jgi:AhpD family alkylhydroperoxidase
MDQRLDYRKAAPQDVAALRNLQSYLDHCDLERSLPEAVKTRASQINGGALCLDMHTKDERAAGESEWREAPFYSERERAALAWTGALARITNGAIDDALYEEVGRHFGEKEIVDLTLAVTAINGWNRLAISFRTPAANYEPLRAAAP